jgi:VIT1/CCC1 family predicted Fe2+/Mn2+ transporter
MNKNTLAALQVEIDAAFLYECVANAQENQELAEYYRQMSGFERFHAQKMMDHWGIKEAPHPSFRAKVWNWIGQKMGYDVVVSQLLKTEKSIGYAAGESKKAAGMQLDGRENIHTVILQSIQSMSGGNVSSVEKRHRTVGGNAIRAAILGANDGLVSNLSLVMGVAGATQGSSEVLVVGMAGLLAGSISMAMGEWISVKGSQEMYERQMELEAEELESHPEEEIRELELLFKSKGFSPEVAKQMVEEISQDPEKLKEVLIREELNIDPEEMKDSAWVAAISSFALFTIGAIFPVLPYFWTEGLNAVLQGAAFSAVGLFLIGAALTLFTGKSIWFSGFRQVIFGLAAALVTYGVGHWLGVKLT